MSQGSYAINHHHSFPTRPPAHNSSQGKDTSVLFRALIAAIIIHLAVIASFTFLPSWQTRGNDVNDIQVFGSNDAAFIQPIDMVNLHDIEQSHQSPVTIESYTQPAPTEPVIAVPRTTTPVRTQTLNATNQKPVTTSQSITINRQPITSNHKPATSNQQPIHNNSIPEIRDSGPKIGGGGGGSSQVLTATTRAGPTLPVSLPAGGNGMQGTLPGTGAGTGSGSGSGTGTGVGSGSGSGNGSGHDSGAASTSGNDTGNSTGANSGNSSGNGNGGESGGAGFVSRLADRSEPQVTRKGTLTYPASAAEEGVEGTVLLKVLVDEEGKVADLDISSSAGDRRLDEAAKTWVKGWRFLPAVQDGRARQVWTKAKVTFRLQ